MGEGRHCVTLNKENLYIKHVTRRQKCENRRALAHIKNDNGELHRQACARAAGRSVIVVGIRRNQTYHAPMHKPRPQLTRNSHSLASMRA